MWGGVGKYGEGVRKCVECGENVGSEGKHGEVCLGCW